MARVNRTNKQGVRQGVTVELNDFDINLPVPGTPATQLGMSHPNGPAVWSGIYVLASDLTP
ncbi:MULTISPECIES: hypothetical protein [unclassified Ruegeria]|uniref:hypothetical protein n=1 Tax=unclassified Ruegeria TaxID=2625375 RepID=UPI001492C348|nr:MULTISPECIES: hypothetical protein [unclassified Ruegeria]NOD87421.1 hypothetical protein [Ruegeria sp. HKCCD4318]NOE12976.1 hypothetical protein [Ruegeria sp. HKCCD4318-2]NOG08857.1 hypothetical protein [Ruegeria sp. HKCCD4315]